MCTHVQKNKTTYCLSLQFRRLCKHLHAGLSRGDIIFSVLERDPTDETIE